MFETVTLRGFAGSIVFGYRDAAIVTAWTVTRDKNRNWSLAANVERADAFQLRQVPLHFQAWRRSKPQGRWYFPILPRTLKLDPIRHTLTAQLGPPEG